VNTGGVTCMGLSLYLTASVTLVLQFTVSKNNKVC